LDASPAARRNLFGSEDVHWGVFEALLAGTIQSELTTKNTNRASKQYRRKQTKE
jgi:hypothetical protein